MTNHESRIQTATLIGKFTPGSIEWHTARRGVGGSDIGTILGLNPWQSAYRLWAVRTGQITEDSHPSLAMELGTYLEPFIRDTWAKENAPFLTVHETGTWQSNSNPNFKANPDGLIEWADGELGILEIKYSSRFWDELPPAYLAQVNWYLHVLGLKRAVLVALTAGQMREFVIDYNEDEALTAEFYAERFLTLVERQSPPDWDGSFSTYETVRQLAPGLQEGETDLGDLWVHLSNAKASYEAAEAELNRVKSATIAQMEGIKTGLYQGQKVITLQASKNGPFIKFNK